MADVSTVGALLYLGDGASPEVFTAVADITEFGDAGSESRETIDTTTLADSVRTHLGGLQDSGSVSVGLKWDLEETTHGTATGLLARLKATSPEPGNFAIKFPAATGGGTAQYAHFAGTVTGASPAMALGEIMRATVTIKRSGVTTYNTTAPSTGA